MQALGANGLQKKINLCPFKWQKKIKWLRLCQSAAFYSSSPSPWPFEPYPFFQLYTNSSSLAIPVQVLKSNSYTAQADYLSIRKAEVHALKTN